ncbi:winged helix-turn-helix transcriptional regulator [Mycetocola spongiae]|uniref:winged helix-turn-helix transcriptional regulator n=1 Tax=Mycetocola spongiae TaxID=2859226 RepID=UPI001CF4E65E|nr:helix-turn-helix domain-containing protein [Mycetocola spongiae]UCR88074.1 helix-turn-helix transcriptional regulator [Mycetocola spongiae]
MALRSDLSAKACSIARGADVLADPWILLLLRELFRGTHRFDALVTATGCSDSVTAKRLTTLREAGLVIRVPYREGGRERHEYRLTAAGADTLPILHALSRWGARHTPDHGTLDISCARCETRPPSADWCPTCALPLTANVTIWRAPTSPEVPERLSGS